jgi:hypothetical protein
MDVFPVNQSISVIFTDVNGVRLPIWQTAMQGNENACWSWQ